MGSVFNNKKDNMRREPSQKISTIYKQDWCKVGSRTFKTVIAAITSQCFTLRVLKVLKFYLYKVSVCRLPEERATSYQDQVLFAALCSFEMLKESEPISSRTDVVCTPAAGLMSRGDALKCQFGRAISGGGMDPVTREQRHNILPSPPHWEFKYSPN